MNLTEQKLDQWVSLDNWCCDVIVIIIIVIITIMYVLRSSHIQVTSNLTTYSTPVQRHPVVGKVDGDLLRGSIREVKGKLERGEISESLSMMTFNLANE